ncbi:MAG: ABC transporter ATP-binding protein [Rhizobacter sp.]|nr:ABC transporter ATP-binding protein [Bacteriovorax sp.]
MIEIQNLTKVYKGTRGLFPTSFKVEKGELIAIVGHNGAGKSTLLKILSNTHLPDSGSVLIDGIDLSERLKMVRKIGFVSETPNLYDFFSVEYNFKLFAKLFDIKKERIDEIIKEFNLENYRHTKVQNLSKGLKQRVNIGRSILSDPPVILFDEPTSGLDFEMTKEVFKLLREFHASGKTILFTTHRPEEIKNLATRLMVLHKGKVVFDGKPSAYFESHLHNELYLQ